MRRNTLAVLAVALSFAALAIDLRFLHRFATHGTWHAYIPSFYCTLASLSLFACLPRWEAARRFGSWVCAFGVLVGGVGLMLHTRGRPLQVMETLDVTAPRATKPAGSTRATSSVAPLSLAGLGGLGWVLVFPGARRRAREAANAHPELKLEPAGTAPRSKAA